MRILYDGIIYATQLAGGVNRYFAQVISRLPDDWSPVMTSKEVPQVQCPTHPALELQLSPRVSGPSTLAKWRMRRFFRRFYANVEADVLHPTCYRLLSNRPLTSARQPVVLTIYDMIHERFPELMDRRRRYAKLKRQAINAARQIICISESTKRDLLEFYPNVEQRVSVIHLAVELGGTSGSGIAAAGKHDELLSTSRFARPYFLYVGSRAPYKNFDRLLRAFSAVAQRHPGFRLVVVGSPLDRGEQQRIAELKLSGHVESLGCVPDVYLRTLYEGSQALVYPSQYEGFGIPILEAMACQTVVVAANTSSIPEVAGDAALLFDPFATDELADVLLDLVARPEQREPLIRRGLRRVQQFSWRQTMAATLSVYKLACGQQIGRAADHVVPRHTTTPQSTERILAG